MPYLLLWIKQILQLKKNYIYYCKNIFRLLAFHKKHGKLATLTAVRPPARFGHLEFEGDRIEKFSEKPQTAEGWINGAFFVLEPEVYDYIEGDDTQSENQQESAIKVVRDRIELIYF